MPTEFDLNIQNYSILDIEKLFHLNSPYSPEDVEKCGEILEKKLKNSGNLPTNMRNQIIVFIQNAKDLLVSYTLMKEQQETDFHVPPPSAKRLKSSEYDDEPYGIPRKVGEYDKSPANTSVGNTRVANEITEPMAKPYVVTMPAEFHPGVINPLKINYITKCLNIDTKFRDSVYTTTSSDFTINLPVKLQKVVSMQLSAFEFPVSFYGISSDYGNNHFTISAKYKSFTDSTTVKTDTKIVIVPDGNYTASELLTEINDILAPTNTDGSLKYTSSVFSYINFSLDVSDSGSGTGKVTVAPNTSSYTDASNITQITMDFSKDKYGNDDTTQLTSKLGWNLGFQYKIYEKNTEYTSESTIDPTGIRYFYLLVDDYNNSVNNFFISAFNKSILNHNILARIPVKGSYFNLMMENDLSTFTEPRRYFGPTTIQKLHIQILDDHGRVLNMNNSDFSFCLNFKMLYE